MVRLLFSPKRSIPYKNTCLSDFQFRPSELDNIQSFDLFASLGEKDRLSDQLRLYNVNIDKLKMKPIYGSIDLENFDNREKLSI